MNKLLLCFVLSFIALMSICSMVIDGSDDVKKFKIRKIKYLSQDVMDEKIARTYLGFKEGDYLTEKQLDILINLAILRFKDYGVFNSVEILSNNSEYSQDEKAVFITLTKGFGYLINASFYWGQVGWKNFLNRGDYIGFIAGINRNIFESKHHFPVGFIYYSQKGGWEWVLRTPFAPFFPLFGSQNSYLHNAFYIGKFGFKLHPDINFGVYFGEKSQFFNDITNLQMLRDGNFSLGAVKYSFAHVRSGFLIGGFFSSDTRYMIEKYRVGHKLTVEGGVNIDATGQNIFAEQSAKLKLDFLPHDYIFIGAGAGLHNQFANKNEYIKFNVKDYIRGDASLGAIYGNFLFNCNFDFRVKFASWTVGGISQTIGISSFYEGFLVTDDYNFLSRSAPIEYRNVVGGGLWIRLGVPVNISIFAELGYTVGEEFGKGYKINIGLVDFF